MISGVKPARRKTTRNMGIRMMPPPIPNSPARIPAKEPTTANRLKIGRERMSMADKRKSQPVKAGLLKMEAPTRFERVMEVLQTSALPLGDGAVNKRKF